MNRIKNIFENLDSNGLEVVKQYIENDELDIYDIKDVINLIIDERENIEKYDFKIGDCFKTIDSNDNYIIAKINEISAYNNLYVEEITISYDNDFIDYSINTMYNNAILSYAQKITNEKYDEIKQSYAKYNENINTLKKNIIKEIKSI